MVKDHELGISKSGLFYFFAHSSLPIISRVSKNITIAPIAITAIILVIAPIIMQVLQQGFNPFFFSLACGADEFCASVDMLYADSGATYLGDTVAFSDIAALCVGVISYFSIGCVVGSAGSYRK